jgi:hypothetical protein
MPIDMEYFVAAEQRAEPHRSGKLAGRAFPYRLQCRAGGFEGDAITINIEQNGDNVSKVSVHVGRTGDADLSNQLITRINKDL